MKKNDLETLDAIFPRNETREKRKQETLERFQCGRVDHRSPSRKNLRKTFRLDAQSEGLEGEAHERFHGCLTTNHQQEENDNERKT